MPRDHHQIAEPAEARDDIFCDPSHRWSLQGSPERFASASTAIAGIANRLALRRLAGPGDGLRRAAPIARLRKISIGLGDILQGGRPNDRIDSLAGSARRLAERAGHQDAARIGYGLETRRDIDAMAIGDRLVKRYFADIEPDAEFDRLAVSPDRLVAKFGLDLNGELQRLVGVVEQRENSVARQVGDPTAVVADQRAEKLNSLVSLGQRSRSCPAPCGD